MTGKLDLLRISKASCELIGLQGTSESSVLAALVSAKTLSVAMNLGTEFTFYSGAAENE